MIYFTTFADSNMAPTLKRIRKEAERSGFFDKIYTFNEKTLDKKFYKPRKAYFQENRRGYGYWLWKPYIIKNILDEKMIEGDVLVYLDAGCEIHKSGEKRWKEYLQILEEQSIIVYEHLHCLEKQYTKYSLFEHFNVLGREDILNSRQIWAGGIILRKDDFSLSLINRWFAECDGHKSDLLCDRPSNHEELPPYVGHRHDQSIFSILCKLSDKSIINNNIKERIKVLPQTESYPFPCDWNNMVDYPFWAKRNKAYKGDSFFNRVENKGFHEKQFLDLVCFL